MDGGLMKQCIFLGGHRKTGLFLGAISKLIFLWSRIKIGIFQ